jgi:hypothetical protein
MRVWALPGACTCTALLKTLDDIITDACKLVGGLCAMPTDYVGQQRAAATLGAALGCSSTAALLGLL